jgi:YidC/Oxa1 family membrane protein insertase
MDRTAWIAIVLASIGLVASIFWEQRQAAEARVKFLQQQAILAAQATPTPQATPVPGPAAADLSTKSLTDQGQHEEQPEQDATLKSDVAELNFSNNKGGLLTVGLLNHRAEQGQLVQLNTDRTAAIGAITQNPNTWQDSGYTLSTDSAAGTATLKRTAPGGLEITKVYTLAKEAGLKDDYQVNLSINFKNNGPASFDTPGFFVSAGAAEPIHRTDRIYATQFDWYRDGKFNSIAVNYFDPGKLFGMFQTSGAKDVYTATADKILWAGVSNQYFATILAPQEIGGQQVWAKPVDIPSEDGQVPIKAILGAIEIPGFSLQTGETKTVNFHIYAGPKEFTRLAKLPNDEADIMNFGWAKWVSELLLTVMNTLHAWVKSYALAIIIMTIIIRSLLWPLQNVATKSMRKMSKLSPIMNELREKYKDDPQRMNQETMKLYKEYGVNPFGGCLPMVVQIPIFFGFYGMLDKAIELRNSSFLWVHDLSQPDTVFHVGGIPINILPLVMAATQLWQMSITPKTGDPAQQRMFLFMPLIFLFICYNYASGLALYWTVQNLFFVAQMYLTRKQADAPLVKIPKAPQVAKRKSYR